jgi:cytochrome P450
VHAGGQMLLSFPAANHDATASENADEFPIDGSKNYAVFFRLGIHRWVGSNLARVELLSALQESLRGFPNYSPDM